MMRAPLAFLVSLVCIVGCALAANLPRLERQPSSGNEFYTIYPKEGTDTSKTSEFVKSIVGTEELLPWTNLKEQLLSWTVEASPDEATRLREYTGVDRVVRFQPPNQPTAQPSTSTTTRAVRDIPAAESPEREQSKDKQSRRDISDDVLSYGVYPKDSDNKAETDKTEKFLQQLLGVANVTPCRINDIVSSWVVYNITESDRGQIAKHPGVDSIEQAEMLSCGRHIELSPRDSINDDRGKYAIQPQDSSDKARTDKTEQFLRQLLGSINVVVSHFDSTVAFWVVYNVTEFDRNQIAKDPGVKSIDRPRKVIKFAFSDQRDIEESPRDTSKNNLDWAAFPRDGNDKADTHKTEEFLKQLLGEFNVYVSHLDSKVRFWAIHNVTQSDRDQISQYPGVRTIAQDDEWLEDSYIELSRRNLHPLPSPTVKLPSLRVKRGLSYATQTSAVSELVAVSQPSTIPDLTDLTNYVYESNSGKQSFIYHLEEGVAFKAQANEFPNVVPDDEHILTDEAIIQGQHPWDDDDPDSHGTCTANKALGKNYGVSKQAKLIVVKMSDADGTEMALALDKIFEDIKKRPGRRKRSVVSLSIGAPPMNPFDWQDEQVKKFTKHLLDIDVPVIVAAGNEVDQGHGVPDVNTTPGLFEGPDYPLIVVGSTDLKGHRSVISQGGPHVFLHAIGEHNTCMLKSGSTPKTNARGTSLSAPMVAGQVANLLSYDNVPFDTSDGNLVRNLRDYLKTDAASWGRDPAVRMIWNGVTEKDNPKILKQISQPATSTPTPTPEPASSPSPPIQRCAGLAARKYISQPALKELIVSKFCPTAVQQGTLDTGSGSLSRRYNERTMEEITIAINWAPGLNFKPSQEECTKYLLSITNTCDGNDPNNPENYKGGGSMVVGAVSYQINPQTYRQPASDGMKGGCSTTYKGVYNENWVWGHGWDSSDNGNALKKAVKGCALLPNTWFFSYGLGDDGREWSAKFRTGVFQKQCVGHAMSSAGAPGGIGCSGSG